MINDRRDAILDQALMRLLVNPPADRRTFMAELRERLVAEAGMSAQQSWYAIQGLVRGLRVR
jgi:hypothetical protein